MRKLKKKVSFLRIESIIFTYAWVVQWNCQLLGRSDDDLSTARSGHEKSKNPDPIDIRLDYVDTYVNTRIRDMLNQSKRVIAHNHAAMHSWKLEDWHAQRSRQGRISFMNRASSFRQLIIHRHIIVRLLIGQFTSNRRIGIRFLRSSPTTRKHFRSDIASAHAHTSSSNPHSSRFQFS